MPPMCASFSDYPDLVWLFGCGMGPTYRSLCQLPLRSRQLHPYVGHSSPAILQTPHTHPSSPSASQQKQPVLLRTTRLLNKTVAGQWEPVTCHGGHVTHVLLACDTTSACWPDGDVIFSRHSDTWAIPTSESCPIPQVGPLLPPSFACGSGKQRVSYSLVCDHRRDCMDGSDEVFCNFQQCIHHSQFQCRNKQVCPVS